MKIEQKPGYTMIGLSAKELDFLAKQDRPAIVGLRGSLIVYREDEDGKVAGPK